MEVVIKVMEMKDAKQLRGTLLNDKKQDIQIEILINALSLVQVLSCVIYPTA